MTAAGPGPGQAAGHTAGQTAGPTVGQTVGQTEPAGVAGRRLSVAVIRARYNRHGGAERFVQRALAALSGRSLALTIIAREWRSGGAGAAATEGAGGGPAGQGPAGDGWPADVRLARVDPFYVGNVWRDASFARAVTGHLARNRYDLVQSHERIPGVMLYRAGDGVHAEFLAQRRRGLSRRGRLGLALNPYHAYMLRAERRMFEHPALRAVICNSEMVREEIASRFGVDRSRLVLIRNGVDLERFRPADDDARQRHRQRFGLPDEAPVFAFVGSGFERKGLAAALRAMADPKAPAGAWLLIAGNDKRRRRYQALAEQLGVVSRVRFLGVVTDVREVLAAADALLMPTLYDPFPNAVLEALACGVPAITSTKSGAAEVIGEAGAGGAEAGEASADEVRAGEVKASEGKAGEVGIGDAGDEAVAGQNEAVAGQHGVPNGFVTDALDIGAIAQAMSEVASVRGGPRHVAMRKAARASVERYSLTALGDDLIALYERLLGYSGSFAAPGAGVGGVPEPGPPAAPGPSPHHG